VGRTLNETDDVLIAQMRAHATAFAASTPIRRVAVVANAPLPPSAQRRDLIDSADLVVRCNSLALDGPADPPCVGSRTNVVVAARTTRPTPGFLHDYRNRAYFVTDIFALGVADPVGWPSSWPADLGAWPVPNRAFGLPLKYLLRPASGGHGVSPTTGTLAAYLAHRLFPEADVMLAGYSFLDDPEQQRWGYHRSELAPAKVIAAHDLRREAAYLHGLIDRGEVRYVA
jgi:hypothetical protein